MRCANKTDLFENAVVSAEEGKTMVWACMVSAKVIFLETSAKKGTNIKEALDELSKYVPWIFKVQLLSFQTQ